MVSEGRSPEEKFLRSSRVALTSHMLLSAAVRCRSTIWETTMRRSMPPQYISPWVKGSKFLLRSRFFCTVEGQTLSWKKSTGRVPPWAPWRRWRTMEPNHQPLVLGGLNSMEKSEAMGSEKERYAPLVSRRTPSLRFVAAERSDAAVEVAGGMPSLLSQRIISSIWFWLSEFSGTQCSWAS